MKRLACVLILYCFKAYCQDFEDYTFAPPVPDPRIEYGLLMVGDTGTGDAAQMKVAAAMVGFCRVVRCDASLLLGDNFYPSGVSSATDPQFQSKFHKPYDPLHIRFYVALGNHDYSNPQAQIDHRGPYWMMPSKYYRAAKGPVEVFALDTNAMNNAQEAWLKKSLGLSTAQWKIVFGHHPVYSYGVHGDTILLKHRVLPILKDQHADIYVSGHDHDKQLIHKDGMLFLVSGAGAQVRRTGFSEGSLYAASTLGFAHMGIFGKRAVLRFVNEDGEVEYAVEISKT